MRHPRRPHPPRAPGADAGHAALEWRSLGERDVRGLRAGLMERPRFFRRHQRLAPLAERDRRRVLFLFHKPDDTRYAN
jgi:hypothetical protein